MMSIDEINKLKKDNERLKNELSWRNELLYKLFKFPTSSTAKRVNYYLDKLKEENNKYKQTLQEIKEIAEFHTTQADSEDVQEDMKQILQKIAESEVSE